MGVKAEFTARNWDSGEIDHAGVNSDNQRRRQPTVSTVSAGRKSWPTVRVEAQQHKSWGEIRGKRFAAGGHQMNFDLTGNTVESLMNALIENPVTLRYLAGAVDMIREQGTNRHGEPLECPPEGFRKHGKTQSSAT